MKNMIKIIRLLEPTLLFLFTVIIVGCGGEDENNNKTNHAPIAEAGAIQFVKTGSLVSLNGNGSSDIDGDSLTYQWSFHVIPDNSAATLSDSMLVSTTFTTDITGEYLIKLDVSDGERWSWDVVSIIAKNITPVASAGQDQNIATGSLVTLDGSESLDADGDNLTYQWSFISKPIGSIATLSDPTVVNPTFIADIDGTYLVILIVNDGIVDSLPDNITITAPIMWKKRYGTEGSGKSVQQTADGGYIIVGTTLDQLYPRESDIYVNKTDQYGDILWEKTYGGEDIDTGYSVQQTNDGGYIIVGNTLSFGPEDLYDYDIYVIKTDANGNVVWEKTYGGIKPDYGHSVQQTSDGGFIITGSTSESLVYLLKIDNTGDITWEKTLNYGNGSSVQQAFDGGYVIFGYSGSEDFYIIKTDETGTVIWEKTYGGTISDYGLSGQQTSDGGYVIAGIKDTTGSGTGVMCVIKTDSLGDKIWENTYLLIAGEYSIAYSIMQTSEGGYVVTGLVGLQGTDHLYLLKIDDMGNIIWEKTYPGVYGYSGKQTSDGGYIVCGFCYYWYRPYVYLMKTNSLGDIQ